MPPPPPLMLYSETACFSLPFQQKKQPSSTSKETECTHRGLSYRCVWIAEQDRTFRSQYYYSSIILLHTTASCGEKKMSFSSRLLRMRTGSSSNSLQSRLCSYCCHHDVCYLSLTKVRIEVQGGRYEFHIGGVACSMQYNYKIFFGHLGT